MLYLDQGKFNDKENWETGFQTQTSKLAIVEIHGFLSQTTRKHRCWCSIRGTKSPYSVGIRSDYGELLPQWSIKSSSVIHNYKNLSISTAHTDQQFVPIDNFNLSINVDPLFKTNGCILFAKYVGGIN